MHCYLNGRKTKANSIRTKEKDFYENVIEKLADTVTIPRILSLSYPHRLSVYLTRSCCSYSATVSHSFSLFLLCNCISLALVVLTL